MKGVITITTKKTYNTPHRGCIVKTRLTEEERQDFEEKCRTFSIGQSEYLQQAIFFGKVFTVLAMCTPICCSGVNFRKEQAQKNMEYLKEILK